jgi:hypothetical protein
MLVILKLLLCGRKLVWPARPDCGVKVRLRTMLDGVVMKLEIGGIFCYILLYIIQYDDFRNCCLTKRSHKPQGCRNLEGKVVGDSIVLTSAQLC